MNPVTNPALLPPGAAPPRSPAVPAVPAVPVAPAAPGAPAGPAARPGAAPGALAGPAARPSGAGDGRSFADALQQASGPAQLQFSRHALARIERRGIELDGPTLKRLGEGVARAAGKGARDSLVLVDGTAFVVSVSNHTVITAVGSEHMKDQVFTNIDSAVIA